ncbi:hypothetical protein [Streptomyces subrutilus]|uniref:hypothetical protein n=1 Tax=Streptomyces subrutilus TaxID=36818 RepID=UPI002E116834|nr:hypothetical protein OG479_32820 [Streptomyces subrutilus]
MTHTLNQITAAMEQLTTALEAHVAALRTLACVTFIEPARHIGEGENAEECPACTGTNSDYPFLCPGPEQPAEAVPDSVLHAS